MYKDLSSHRTAEELSFAFSLLLLQPLSRHEAAILFEELWNEANAAATACLPDGAAFSYIELLKEMDRRWRHVRTLH
jgi:hypothetical protein